MSDPGNSPSPYEQSPVNYQTVDLQAAGQTHIKLATIFNYIAGGLDLAYSLIVLAFLLFFAFVANSGRLPFSPPGAPTTAPGMPETVFVIIYYSFCVLASATVGTLKLIAATKLRKYGRNARVWGYIAGIAGCTQIWCSICCILPLACGIYTIVAMSLDTTRAALAHSQSR